LYTASLIALDIKTGELRWYHQITPHDIWGYDLATPPVLIDVPLNGKRVPGIAQATKSGWIYFFDRVTGEVIRRSEPFVPQSNLFKRARNSHKPIKNLIMDANFLVGVGNIYANEALFGANIHPETPNDKLDETDWRRRFGGPHGSLLRALMERNGADHGRDC